MAPTVVAAGLIAAGLIAAGCGVASTASDQPSLGSTSADPSPGEPASSVGNSAGDQEPAPSRLRIPTIAVDAAMVPLGLLDDGRIDVPSDFDQTGWWADGPEPGEVGPAVILGHVDSREGPAVFFGLGELEAGDPIHVDRLDGSTVTYVVERIEQHPKDAFPTEAVYGPTSEPVVRLVTCGGDFDRERRSYDDNLVVFARLAA